MLSYLLVTYSTLLPALAGSLSQRDSPSAKCLFDQSTAGAPIGVDPTCTTGCDESGCDVLTGGLRFASFIGASYANTSISCNSREVCSGGLNKVAVLPYGATSNISSPTGRAHAAQSYDFGCQVKLKGDAAQRTATLYALFPQLKSAGSGVRKALRKVTSLPVRCNSTATVTSSCEPYGPSTCRFVPQAVDQVAGVPLPAGVVIRPVDGIGLPAQPLVHCSFEGYNCVKALRLAITKLPGALRKHGLCTSDVKLVIDNYAWYGL